jgi:hypothetical protein
MFSMYLFFSDIIIQEGQVMAANSAPVITHLAKEFGSEFEEMDSHKLALIDSRTGSI